MKARATDLLLLLTVPLLVALGSVVTLAALLLATVGAPVWVAIAVAALWRRDRRLPPDEDGSGTSAPLAPRGTSRLRAFVPGAVRP